MKIVLVIPTLSYGGAERVMSELANKWAEKNHDITLVLLATGEKAYVLNPKIKLIELGFENPGAIKRIFIEIKLLFVLRNILKNINPDFVLSFMCKYNVFTLISSFLLKLKIYVSDRNNPKNKLPFLTRNLRKITYKYAAGVIAQTELAKKLIFEETGNKNIIVIPNPLKSIQHYPYIKRDKIILNIGRLHPQKGQSILLEIFSKANLPEWKLVILGSGDLLNALQNKAMNLGIEKRVLFMGNVSNVDEWFAKSSIFVFTSLYEGFPNALAEAMSAGLPCISFDCDTGPAELIENGKNGYLIPVGDMELFTKKLKKLTQDANERERLGKNALSVKDRLNIDVIASQYLDFCTRNKK